MHKDYSLLGSTVLVTGGAGYIGSYLVDELISAGLKVVVVDDLRRAGDRNIAHCLDRVKLAVVDIVNVDQLALVFKEYNPETVFHIAALHFIPYCNTHPNETIRVNTLGTQKVVDCCARFGVQNIFYASTAAVYAPAIEPHRESSELGPCDIYGVTKLDGERIIEQMKPSPDRIVRIGRYFNAVGLRETNPHIVPEIYDQLTASPKDVAQLKLGDTTPLRDYIHARDLASASIQSLLCNRDLTSDVLNIGSGQTWSVDDLIQKISEITGIQIEVIRDPARVRVNDRPVLCANPDRLLGAYRYVPQESLQTALQEVFGPLRTNCHPPCNPIPVEGESERPIPV